MGLHSGRPELRLPAVLLAASVVPFVFGEVTSFAHPAYAEVFALFDLALLPFALEPQSAEPTVRTPSSTSDVVSG